MPIRGSLQEASLADVIQLLALGRKTGGLSVMDRHNFGSIFFDQGKICHASIVNRRDRLGDILVKTGLITQQQLDQAIEHQENDRKARLGEILVKNGWVSRGTLEHHMRVQIEEAVLFLFTWTEGSFTFDSDVSPDPEDFLVDIDPESLLLEGARRVDEWSVIAKKIPSLEVVPVLDGDRLAGSSAELTDTQQKVLPLINGTRDVAQIVEDSGLVEFDVGKAIYGLMSAGFVRCTRKSAVRKAIPSENQLKEHENLGLAFYRTGMYAESMREFRRVVDLRPDSGKAKFYLGLLSLVQGGWEDANNWLRQAASHLGPLTPVLHNLALGLEHSGDLEEAERTYSEAEDQKPQDPRVLIGWGVAALKLGRVEDAVRRLDRARESVEGEQMPALWYWARALAAASDGHLVDARQILNQGLKAHPNEAALLNNLAVLAEMAGDLEQAEDYLGRALELEPSLPQLSKNLGDLRYRAGDYDAAWESYRRAVKLDPELGDDVYFKLGNIAYKRNDRDQAAEYWNRTLDLNPDHEVARTNLETMRALA